MVREQGHPGGTLEKGVLEKWRMIGERCDTLRGGRGKSLSPWKLLWL